ncbi:MAG: polyprenyl synthetase family protein, partial [Fervidobacterium sp.]
LRSFSNCYVKTCFGQLLDIITSNRINDEYIKSNIPKKISEMKTAYYTFIYPMILGYYLSEKDEKNDTDEKSEKIEKSKERKLGKFREIELITNAGLHAGIAFQYKDDIIGVFGGDEKTLNDLSEGKLTSIVKKTYENLTGKEKETFIELIKKQEKTQADLKVLKNLIVKSKAKEEIIKEVNTHKKASLEFLERLDMNIKEKEIISKLISNVLEIE